MADMEVAAVVMVEEDMEAAVVMVAADMGEVVDLAAEVLEVEEEVGVVEDEVEGVVVDVVTPENWTQNMNSSGNCLWGD